MVTAAAAVVAVVAVVSDWLTREANGKMANGSQPSGTAYMHACIFLSKKKPNKRQEEVQRSGLVV